MRRAIFALAFLAPSLLLAQPRPGDLVTSGPHTAKRIALSFDDGPGPHTAKYLDLLARYDAKATFFMLAEQVKYRPQIARAVAERGHEIASHTYNHTNYLKTYRSAAESNPDSPDKAAAQARTTLVDDIKKSRTIIEDATGARLKLLRMPHGVDRPWIKDAARETGFVLVNWTYGADWLVDDTNKLKDAYLKAIEPGAVILLHDGGSKREKSLALTEAVLQSAKDRGFEIVTVGELIGTSTKP
jgi:peptidoglycan-N-acetylglucosamine deacetylase